MYDCYIVGGNISSHCIRRIRRYSQTPKTHLEILHVFVGSVFITYQKWKIIKVVPPIKWNKY